MVDGYGKQIKRILRENGWVKLRQGRGDHEIWIDPTTGNQVTVDNTKSRFTAQEILKSAGIRHRI